MIANQLDLPTRATIEEPKWQREFEQWVHTSEGRECMDIFIRLAWGVMQRGKRIGAKAIAERIRWHYSVRKSAGQSYKLNNNYVSFMARFAMDREPRLYGFFETREVRL